MAQLVQLPDSVDLSFVAGDTFRIRVRVIDPADNTAIPINPDADQILGESGEYNFCAEIAQDPDHTKIVSAFVITPDPDNPSTAVVLTLPPSETAALPYIGDAGGTFHGAWDLEVKFPNGDIRTVATGTVTCVADISNCAPLAGPMVLFGAPGAPGTWLPVGPRYTSPPDVTTLISSSITSTTGATPWPSGDYIQTGTSGSAGEAHWTGTVWTAGRAP
jgi:hypothetical protein